jgi:hypothetical protein
VGEGDTLRLHETRNANNLLSQTERLEIVKQKTNTCIDAANAEYYVKCT